MDKLEYLKRNYKLFGILGAGLLLCFLVFFLTFFFNVKEEGQTKDISPTFTPLYATTGAKVVEEETKRMERKRLVQNFQSKLPYKGKYITIKFDSVTGITLVNLKREDEQRGKTELQEILKKNSIDDRSWIADLVIEYTD